MTKRSSPQSCKRSYPIPELLEECPDVFSNRTSPKRRSGGCDDLELLSAMVEYQSAIVPGGRLSPRRKLTTKDNLRRQNAAIITAPRQSRIGESLQTVLSTRNARNNLEIVDCPIISTVEAMRPSKNQTRLTVEVNIKVTCTPAHYISLPSYANTVYSSYNTPTVPELVRRLVTMEATLNSSNDKPVGRTASRTGSNVGMWLLDGNYTVEKKMYVFNSKKYIKTQDHPVLVTVEGYAEINNKDENLSMINYGTISRVRDVCYQFGLILSNPLNDNEIPGLSVVVGKEFDIVSQLNKLTLDAHDLPPTATNTAQRAIGLHEHAKLNNLPSIWDLK